MANHNKKEEEIASFLEKAHQPSVVSQDLPGACSITDLHDALELSEVGERKMFLIGTCVKKGEAEISSGVRDARELIIQMASGK